jgi:hypothetical protein
MYEQVENLKENKSWAVANSVSQKQSSGESAFQFVDNRPEATKQRKLYKVVTNNSILQRFNDNQQSHDVSYKPGVHDIKNDLTVERPIEDTSVSQFLKVSYTEIGGATNHDNILDTDQDSTGSLTERSDDELFNIIGNLENHPLLNDIEEIPAQLLLKQAKAEYNKRKLKEHIENAVNGWEDEENPVLPWEERFGPPGKGGTLHDLVYNVVIEEEGIAGMSYDKIYKYEPKTQLAFCLEQCRDSKEDVLALCLYTSYFYESLNKYFRGQLVPDGGTNFGALIIKTAEVLRTDYKEADDTKLEARRFRLELKAGWIGSKNIDDTIIFAALTSTHPDLGGVNGMWSDIAAGTFGDYDNFALLIFEGTAKLKRPDPKYFTGEIEDLMGPDSVYKITDKYTLTGTITGIDGQQNVAVYHLNNTEEPEDSPRIRFAGASELAE